MAFTDEQKRKALEDEMIHSLQEGTDWSVFKAEFLAMPEPYRNETIDNLDEAIDKQEEIATEAQDKLNSMRDLKQELTS